jgi:ABC-type spermidine/putrescine transport system permease subunit II
MVIALTPTEGPSAANRPRRSQLLTATAWGGGFGAVLGLVVGVFVLEGRDRTSVDVVVVMRGRLLGIGPEYEEVAMDLGAKPIQALWRVLLPLLAPAIFASFMIVFALSIDDFVTSQFLFKDQGTITIPMLIYGTGRTGLNPSLNAVATVMLVLSLTAIAIAALAMGGIARRRGTTDASGARDLVRFEL